MIVHGNAHLFEVVGMVAALFVRIFVQTNSEYALVFEIHFAFSGVNTYVPIRAKNVNLALRKTYHSCHFREGKSVLTHFTYFFSITGSG